MVTRQVIAPNRMALFLEPPDMEAHGIKEPDPDSNAVHTLVMGAFACSGIQPSGGMEIEIYASKGGLLVFAEFGAGLSGDIVAFKSADDLADAVAALPFSPGISRLMYYEGTYYLEIRDLAPNLQVLTSWLSEFGAVTKKRGLDLFLSEHGRVIEDYDAVGKLRAAFCPEKAR
ncbi:hypothetical protein LJC32_05900 [Oscillospiraceae bacterium OttesenSCG-928-F05]|nr:hypothetical protein [Oscillospiraceae bacterium OttesenSCG-928-F05]